MSDCSDEARWFLFFWRIENASMWKPGCEGTVFCTTSPVFMIPSLSKTKWYARLHGDGRFCLHRNRDDVGPEKIRVGWKVSILKEGGSDVTSDVQEHGFEREGERFTCFGVDVLDFVGSRGDIRLSVWVRREKLRISKDQNETTPCKCSGPTNLHEKMCPSAPTADYPFPLECHGVTVVVVKMISFRLDDSSFNTLRRQRKLSTLVSSASGYPTHFCIRCSVDDNSEYATIRIKKLWHTKRNRIGVHVVCDAYFENAKSEISRHEKGCLTFINDADAITFTDFVKRRELISDDSEIPEESSLRLNIAFGDGEPRWIENTTYWRTGREKKKKGSLPSIKENLLRLYEKQTYCDVTLEMGDGTLKAHKTVLEAWSDVFAAMLNSSTIERDSKTVRIKDIGKATMEAFLRFLYSDSVEISDFPTAVDLYFAADKYRVLPLRDTCSDYLEGHLSSDVVCEVLNLADRHGDEGLKQAAINFLLARRSCYFDTKDWKNFIEANFKLASDVLKSVCKK